MFETRGWVTVGLASKGNAKEDIRQKDLESSALKRVRVFHSSSSAANQKDPKKKSLGGQSRACHCSSVEASCRRDGQRGPS